MDVQKLQETFNKLLESNVGVTRWNSNRPFTFDGKNIPSQLPGFETFSDQFQSNAFGDLPRFCYTSEILIREIGEYFTASTYVIEVVSVIIPNYGIIYSPIRWFNIEMAFNPKGDIIPDLSTLKMYEKGTEVTNIEAPPLPPLPGPLGTAIDIAKWGIEFSTWIAKYLPNDWGGLGLAVSEIAEMIAYEISTADFILDGEANLDIIMAYSFSIFTMLALQDYKPDGVHGLCKIVKWRGDEEARIYQPRIICGAASWTLLLKVDRMRSWAYNDDHLIVSITGDYHSTSGKDEKEHIIGVMSSWKFVDADPEEGEFDIAESEEKIGCFDEWQLKIGAQFGKQTPVDFIDWYAKNYLRKWMDEINSLELHDPKNVDLEFIKSKLV